MFSKIDSIPALLLAVVGLVSASGPAGWASYHCPEDKSSNFSLPTPTYGTEERLWMICTELLIDAPIQVVYDTLIDYQNYHLWNSFVVDIALPPDVINTPEDVYVGMEMIFTVAGLDPTNNLTSSEVVTMLDDEHSHGKSGYLLNAWRSNVFFDGLLSRAEHPNILTRAKGGKTRYVSYETYYEGPAVDLIYGIRPQLQASFDQQGLDLKAYIEGS